LYRGKRGGRRRVWERGRGGGALTIVEVVTVGEVVGEVVAVGEREREGVEAGIDVCGGCRCFGYRGIPVHLLLGPIIGPSSAQGKDNDPSCGEDPHEEAPREENDDQNC
jgi:hypothetical protein